MHQLPQTDAFFDDPERIRFAVQASGAGIWEVDITTHSLIWDQRCRELFGIQQGEAVLTYEKMFPYIHQDDLARVRRSIDEALTNKDGGRYDQQYRVIGIDDGKMRWVRFSGQAVFNEQGMCIRFGGLAQEITDTAFATDKIKEAQDLAEIALSGANAGSFRILLDDDHIEYSPAFARILTGEENTQLSRADFIEHIHSDDQHLRQQAYEKALHTGRLYYEARTVWNDQSLHWIEVIGTYIPDPDGKPKVYTGTIRDTTEAKAQEQAFRESEAKFQSLIDQAPVATCLWVGRDMVIEVANDIMLSYWGKDRSVIGRPLAEAVPELEGQPYLDILDRVYTTGIAHSEKSARADLKVDGVISPFYFDFTYKPVYNAHGEVYGIMNMAIDVTEQVLAKRKLEENEAKLRSVITNAPAAMGLFVGRELVVEMPNKTFIDIVGKGPDIVGKPLSQVMPELEDQPFLQILDDVFTTGKMYQSFGTQVNIVQQGVMTHKFYNITYSPLFDAAGNVYAILDIAIDVTDRVIIQKEIEESRLQLLSLFEQSPIAIAIISRDNLVFRMANPFYAELVGRLPGEIIGKPLLDALPELKGQGFDQLLHGVIDTGKPFIANEVAVDIVRKGKMETIYVDLTYQPQREKDQSISGILVVATDVTQQVLTRQKIEEAEADLRNALELAELATWSIDAASGMITYDGRMKDWIGVYTDERDFEQGMNPVPEPDRDRVRKALEWALNPASNGNYDQEHYVVHLRSGKRRIIHAQARRYDDAQGRPLRLAGTARDITLQRELQIALEQEVQERTEELAASNEELQVTNEELADANNRLVHSNEELKQYAYVASHDLQEPLRKIRMFSGMLNGKTDLSSESRQLIGKIAQSSERMTLLIRDLLEFSRLLKSESLVRAVDLNEIVAAVANDFELAIIEQKAAITIGKLPVIEAVALQMNQLFYNLIANALKFGKPGIAPVITISSAPVTRAEAAKYLSKTLPASQYHRISIADNGIGFDINYAEKIFEVFQRLHGRDIYPGSGIGLALCRRIVNNHNGSLYAWSEEGAGSVFHLLIPESQEGNPVPFPR